MASNVTATATVTTATTTTGGEDNPYDGNSAFWPNAILNVVSAAEFFLTGPLIILSFPMTVLTALVFIRSPLGTTKTTRVYYTTIAICNFMSTVFRDVTINYPWFVLPFLSLNLIYWDPEFISEWSCRSLDFMLFSFEMITNNVFLALTLERCLVLFWPLRTASLISKRKAMAGVLLVFVASFLICSCTLAGASNLIVNASKTYIACTVNYYSTNFVSELALCMMLLSWIVPISLTALLNAMVLLKLFRNRQGAMKFGAQQSSTKSSEATVTLLVITGIHLVIYIPMGSLHTVPLLMSMAGLSVPKYLSILSIACYPLLPITHVANFVVYYIRVKGFKENLARVAKCDAMLK